MSHMTHMSVKNYKVHIKKVN